MRHTLPLSIMLASIMMFAFGVHSTLVYGCGPDRLTWWLCHCNVWHLIGNLVAIHAIVKSNFNDAWWMWLVGICLQLVMPESAHATQGASGVIYVVLGIISMQAENKLRFNLVTLAFMALGLIWPDRINNLVHFLSYAVGWIIGAKVYIK